MKKIIELWREDKPLIILPVLAILLIWMMLYFTIKESEQWEAFKVTQNCKVVGHEKGHVSTGVGPVMSGNGGVAVIVTSTPDKTGWLCDDNITYWR